jgi:hypothetical protein
VTVRNIMAGLVNSAITCGIRQATRARANAGVKVWRYRYYGEWPNQRLSPRSGAFFGSEIPIVFGSAAYYTDIPDVPEEAKLSAVVRRAWTEFAKDPKNGLTRLGWPTYDESSKSSAIRSNKAYINHSATEPTLVRLGYQNKAEITFESPKDHDRACDMGSEFAAALSGSPSAWSNWMGSVMNGPRGSGLKGWRWNDTGTKKYPIVT